MAIGKRKAPAVDYANDSKYKKVKGSIYKRLPPYPEDKKSQSSKLTSKGKNYCKGFGLGVNLFLFGNSGQSTWNDERTYFEKHGIIDR
jgi:hypothetical protein